MKDDALLRHNVRSIKDRLLTEEGYYINNAGLVLLAPFLERLFENVGYVEGKKWKSKETQQRAIGLLHFIVTGDIVFREYNLLLNKIVVGYEVHQSLPYDLILSDFEKQEGLDVLTSIIEHWKALKNTSVDGLRTGFLQREGKLCAMPDEWHLKVQQLTLDILLDRLPWGYSVVKTPWMSKMLKVEWA